MLRVVIYLHICCVLNCTCVFVSERMSERCAYSASYRQTGAVIRAFSFHAIFIQTTFLLSIRFRFVRASVYISMWWKPTCIVIKVATFLSRQMLKLKQHTFKKKNSFAYFISSNSIFFRFHSFFYDYFCSVSWFISLSFHITFKLTRWLNKKQQ